jgi:nitrogen-specific signal transduction histidine kinase
LDLEGLVEELIGRAELPDNIQASCQVEAKVKVMMSDADLLERVLSNLISNAVQAMPDGENSLFLPFETQAMWLSRFKTQALVYPWRQRIICLHPYSRPKIKDKGSGWLLLRGLFSR